MACRAVPDSERRSRGGVGRVIGLLPGRQVALRVPAIRGLDGQAVVVIDVAGSARQVSVPVGQQETCGAVIEDRRGPGNRVMARRAVRNCKLCSRCRVHRIIRRLPGRQVAA